MGNISVKKLHTFLGHNDSIYTLCAVDEKRFLSAGGDGMVVLWDLETPDEGEVIAKISGSIYTISYNEKTGFLYVGHNNEGIHKIDLKSKKEVGSINLGNHQIFTIKQIEHTIWVGLQSGEVVILSEDLEVIDRKKVAADRVRHIDKYESDLAIACSDNVTRIKKINSKEEAKQLIGHKNSVFTAKYHPSGKYLASVWERCTHKNLGHQ